MSKICIGSRESRLAVIQSEMVMNHIRTCHPELEVELLTMKTTGDIILDRSLDQVGGKGLFVKELDRALLDRRSDLSVHSLKDMPMEVPKELPVVAFSKREDPRDVLVLPEGGKEPDFSKPIGCASLRRKIQLEKLYPEAQIAPVRGNVQTRLRKLEEGQYSALVLAGAGLKRLDLEGRIARYFSPEEILPAAGQGILAAQMRAGEDVSFLDAFSDREGTACALAERAFVRELDGGCSSPVAAFATVSGDTMTLTGMNVSGEKDTITGAVGEAVQLGIALAKRLR